MNPSPMLILSNFSDDVADCMMSISLLKVFLSISICILQPSDARIRRAMDVSKTSTDSRLKSVVPHSQNSACLHERQERLRLLA